MRDWQERHRPAQVAPIIAARWYRDQIQPRRNQRPVDQASEGARIEKGRTRYDVACVERNHRIARIGNNGARPSSNVGPDDSRSAVGRALSPEHRPPRISRMQVGAAAQMASIPREPLFRERWQRLEDSTAFFVRPDNVLRRTLAIAADRLTA